MRFVPYAAYTALAAAVVLTAGCATMTETQQGAARGALLGFGHGLSLIHI